MRRTLGLTMLLMAVGMVYCTDTTGPADGPVRFGIVAGDGQVVPAGRDSLLEPVLGRAYRDANGNLSFAFGAAPLHAQTTIGTGVPNVLTCAEPVGDHGLRPWQSCRQTDANGDVVYWFEPGTVAGEACAEIRATPNGEPEVLATTCSTVAPGALESFRLVRPGTVDQSITVGQQIDARPLVDMARDAYGNAIDPAVIGAYDGARVGWAWHDRVTGSTAGSPDAPAGTGWVVTVPDFEAEGYHVDHQGGYSVALHLWIDGIRSTERAAFTVAP